MAAADDFVTVRKSLLDRLRQHCDFAPDAEPLQDFSPRSEPQELAQLPEPQPPSQLSKPRRPRKDEAADWFLRNAPKATEWRKRQTELELNTVAQYEEVIQAFTGRTNIPPKREPYQGNGHSEYKLVGLVERFALPRRKAPANIKLQKSIATFQALILLSYCGVLRKRGVSYEILDRIIQHMASRKSDRRRLLASALWVNGVIVDLVSHG